MYFGAIFDDTWWMKRIFSPQRLAILALSAIGSAAYLWYKGQKEDAMSGRYDGRSSSKDVSARQASAFGRGSQSSESSKASSDDAMDEEPEKSTNNNSAESFASPSAYETTSADTNEDSNLALKLESFLMGENWYNRASWVNAWGVHLPEGATAKEWISSQGVEVLNIAIESCREGLPNVSGCRRRWIVVCRYADVDLEEALSLWQRASR